MPETVTRRDLLWGAGGLVAVVCEIARIYIDQARHGEDDKGVLRGYQLLLEQLAAEKARLVEKCGGLGA
jgi:hypothetical protein